MDELLRTANEGRLLRRGIRAAIIGRPNVGKSSLLNQLLGHDRAIVSPRPGTTRDTIEETANVRGVPVVFIDTAGLREAADEIEAEGVRRSRHALAAAELILHVLDGSEPLGADRQAWVTEYAGRKRLLVRNKADLPRRLMNCPPGWPRLSVSCLTGAGVEELKDAIQETVWAGGIHAEMLQVMINSRHEDALRRGARGGGAGGRRRCGPIWAWNWRPWTSAWPPTPSARSSGKRPRKTCWTPFSASFAWGSRESRWTNFLPPPGRAYAITLGRFARRRYNTNNTKPISNRHTAKSVA
jgi:small GTP-binding protein